MITNVLSYIGFVLVGIIVYVLPICALIKKRKLIIESIKIEEESKLLTKQLKAKTTYHDFTEGHLYQ